MPLAKQLTNKGARGQDARYDIRGLQQVRPGVYSDGTYEYDERGLDLSGRQAQYIQGMRQADELNGGEAWDPGGGGGGGGPIPGVGIYGQAVAAAKARYQQRLADLTKQRQSTFRQSGFQGDINEETGLVSNLRVDPYNQYGTFQLLNKAQAQRADQGQAMNIERGLGTRGGLAAQNMNELRFGFGQEDASFGAGLADQLGAFTRQQQDYKYEYDAALYQAQLEAARMAIENGDFYGYGGGEEGYGESGGEHPAGLGVARGALKAGQAKPKNRGKPKPRPAAGFGGGLAAAQIAARRRGRR